MAQLATTAGAAWLLHRTLPLAADDPFRPVLVILPLVVAALSAVERRAPRPGTTGIAGAAALAVLVLLTLGRQSFGLAATDWFLAAGYLLLLAARVGRLLLTLRPLLGNRLPARPDAAFFFLPLVVYLALQPWLADHRQPDGDEPYYLLVTHSLVHDFDAELSNNYAAGDWHAFMDRPLEPQPGDPEGPGGEVYSRHNVLLPLVLAPAYLVAGRFGAMATMAAMSAALAFMVLRLAHHYGEGKARPGAALLAYAFFAFGPPLLVYSYQVWIEVPAALLVSVALDRVLVLRRAARPPTRGELAVLALVLAMLPLVKLRLALVALPLLVLAWRAAGVGGGGRRLAALWVAVPVAALGGLLLYNQLLYGNPLKTHRFDELKLYSSSAADFARGAVGMFYDSAFGLFACAPLWLLVLPALWLAVRRRDRLLVDGALLAGLYLVALAPRFEWYGGWSPPFRYPLVFLPLLALLLIPLLELRWRPGLALLLAGLGALTVVLTLVWVVVPGWTYNFADGRTHLLDLASARLGADVARLFPSTVRPRAATWVWPLLSLVSIPLALAPGRRRFTAAARPWGLVLLLVATAAVPVLAARWPTRVTEVEDAYVKKERGWVFPDLWVVQRPRYPAGWAIPPRGRVVAPVVAGGETARLEVVVYTPPAAGPVRLDLAAGERRLATLEIEPGEWRTLTAGPFDWPAGEPLVISGSGGGRRPVLVDRVVWAWQ